MGYESQKTLFITYRNGTNGTNGTDGISPKDFNLTASAYAIIKDKDGNIKGNNQITLTAHLMNVSGTVYWYEVDGNEETLIKKDGKNYTGITYTTTEPGTYAARVTHDEITYRDEVTIVEVQDGADGKPAISIMLSNPTMTFNTSTTGEAETCEVMVYEGGEKLGYGSGNGKFQVYKGAIENTSNQTALDGEMITIYDTTINGNGYETYTVFGTTKQGDNFRQQLTIYWTVVENGTSPYSISLDNDSDTLVISSADGQWISSGCIVNATKYLGSNIQTSGHLDWSLEKASNEWKLDDGTINDWNYQITTAGSGSSEATLKIRTKDANGASVLENITEATFVATWKDETDNNTTYAAKKFSIKVLSSLSDYDLIVPQTVYNKKNIITSGDNKTKVSVSVQKKSASGTESLAYNASSAICPVRIYKKTSTGYTNIEDWSAGIPFSSDEGMHLVLGSAVTTTSNVPEIIWDEEIIEVVEDGAQGPSGLILSLDNDSDVFVTKADGTSVSSPIEVTPILTRDGVEEENKTFELVSFPESFKDGESLKTDHASFDGKKLIIEKIPEGFEHGIFTFGWGDLRASFTLRAVQSNVDYNLCFDKTVVNSSTAGSVQVWVNKTDETGKVTRLDKPETIEDKNLTIFVNGTELEVDATGKWLAIEYSKGENTSKIVTLKLGDFEWDNESIEFIHDAPAIRINSDKLQFNVNGNGELYDTQNATLTLWGRGVDVDRAVWHTNGEYLGEGSIIQVSQELFDGEIPSGSSGRLRFLYAKNGQVFAGNTDEEILYTTNGEWESHSISETPPRVPEVVPLGATYFKGKYYVVDYYANIHEFNPQAQVDSDEKFTKQSIDGLAKAESIISNGKVMLVIGADGNGKPQYCYSTNGVNWTAGMNTTNGSWEEDQPADTLTSVCLTNNGFFASGFANGYSYLINEDGSYKSKSQVSTSGTSLRCAYYSNGKYFVGQHLSKDSIFVGTQSSDGITWNSVEINASYSIRSITYFNGLYWAFGYKSGVKGNVIYKSSDGSNWEEHTTTNGDEGIWCSTIIGNQLYYAGEKGNITKFQTSNSIAITAAVDDVYDTLSLTKVYDGPTGLSGLTLSLDNDSDVFVTRADGTPLSKTVSVVPTVTRDGLVEATATESVSLASFPDEFKAEGEGLDGQYAEFTERDDKKQLIISAIPEGFESGVFTFASKGMTTSFLLRAVQSNVDYDLCFEKTLINNSLSGSKIKVWVNKTQEDGSITKLEGPEIFDAGKTTEKTLNIYYGDTCLETTDGKWNGIPYIAGKDQTDILVSLKLENSGSNTVDSSFEWDEETIEFVQNGQAAQDFSVTASAYAFVDSADEKNSVNAITLTATPKNLSDSTIFWYKGDNSESIGTGSSITIYRTKQTDENLPYGVGTYTAQYGSTGWKDSVTIGLVSDGPGGKPAISISLSNPTMVFNSNNSSETETCKVIVYEGGTTLSPGSGNGKFSITAVSANASQDVIKDDTITIAKPTTATTKTYRVTIKPTAGGNEQTSTITINCTLVDDGEDGVYTSLQADPAVIHSTDLSKTENYITFTAYEKVGGKETEPLNLTSDYSYKYKWDNQGYTTVSFTSESSEFEINATHSGSPKTLKVELYKSDVLIASQTVEVLYDVVRREYFLYHDATTDAAPELPTELDWRKFKNLRDGASGWYKTQDETYSYYYISKRNAYDEEEQVDKPWFGPMEIKQTPLTYDSWWNALDQATSGDKTKGIYSLEKDGVHAVGINADFIKTGALKICPKKFENNAWVDEPTSAVFETGWEFSTSAGTDINTPGSGDELVPYVKIGGVDFTGYVPASTKQLSGPNLLISDENGIHLYGSSPITWAENKTYEGYKITLTGPYKETFAQEVFYRFMHPNYSYNTLYSLKAGSTYTLTGKAKISGGNQGDVLKFRSLVSNGSGWENYEFFDIVTRTNKQSEESDEANISVLFKVPEDAKGFCFSFQLYDKNEGVVKNESYVGTIILEDLRLLGNTLDVSGGYSWKFDQQDGLMMWTGTQGNGTITGSSPDPNLMFKIYKDDKDEGKLWLKGSGEFTGKIIANAGQIGSMSIDAINELSERPLGDNLYVGSSDYSVGEWNIPNHARDTGTTDEFGNKIYYFVNDPEVAVTGTIDDGIYQMVNIRPGRAYTVSALATVESSLPTGTGSITIMYELSGPSVLPLTSTVYTAIGRNEYKKIYYTIPAEDTANRNQLIFAFIQRDEGLKISSLKIEEGTLATGWRKSSRENMSCEANTNNYSWKFSPTEGMFMWGGAQPTNPDNTQTKDALFAIYNAGDATNPQYKLHMKGDGEFTGDIYADGGTIAGWTIGMNTGAGEKGGYIRTGEIGSEGSFHMYSAFYGGDTTIGGHSDGSWSLIIGANFGVNNKGELYCSMANITGSVSATSGSIGGWNIGSSSLVNGYANSDNIMGLFTNYTGIPTSIDNSALTNTSVAVGDSGNKNNWRIFIGPPSKGNFGVDAEGNLHASKIYIYGQSEGTDDTGTTTGNWSIKDGQGIVYKNADGEKRVEINHLGVRSKKFEMGATFEQLYDAYYNGLAKDEVLEQCHIDYVLGRGYIGYERQIGKGEGKTPTEDSGSLVIRKLVKLLSSFASASADEYTIKFGKVDSGSHSLEDKERTITIQSVTSIVNVQVTLIRNSTWSGTPNGASVYVNNNSFTIKFSDDDYGCYWWALCKI